MKNIPIILLFFACLVQLQAQTVSETTALEVAARYFTAKTGKVATMTTTQTTAMRGGTPAYYVCRPATGKGFVIVAGTKASIPILAYSADNNFSTEHQSPEVQYWMQWYEAQLTEIREKRLQPTPEMNALWKNLEGGTYSTPESNTYVDSLLRTDWDQSPFYNQYCPSANGEQAPTGCVATALAQIMKYWNFPVTGSICITDVDAGPGNGITGSFTACVGGFYYNWDNMPNKLDAATPQNQIDQVARLSYHCGVATKMNYGTQESVSNINFARDALKNYFGYPGCTIVVRNSFSPADWITKIHNELDQGRPVFYGGSGTAGGHAWVCDGYEGDMFHMNWGWGGSCVGLFSLTNLNPACINGTLSDIQSAIIGIQPPGCTAFFEGALPLLNNTAVFPLETTNYIHITGGTVEPGMVCNLNAGNEIVLKPGFKALTGSTARFYIEGCNGAFMPPNEEEDRSNVEPFVSVAVPADLNILPNPFIGSTTITYSLPAEQPVDIQIYNALGNVVAHPVRQENQPAGTYEQTFEANELPPGIYLLVLQIGKQKLTKRLVLTR